MKAAASMLLRGYQQWVSPLLPRACRFVPSCSEYALEAIDRYGIVAGSILAVWRLLRCQPLSRGGFDPVPRSQPHFNVCKR
jgi:putative membrane protein insertion efficiency factor